ncbi:Alpha/Beta hydrolase protein [Dactylonectria macrodidyma]|uniref:Alpha/Beta hydrolase protein n=1 Tax=Dactylonectria macrodidyma TaxID=307937 RepID=A0A9P9FLS5_9HYPO|nr:Alpha/Beta hydrolase protein [Dactylonectria macrodidyma]
MNMLPEPTLTLTLPSLNDGLTLDCRIYHPLSLAANPRAPPWQRHAAVIAHPYAPFGGCYDDPVVDTVAGQLLRKGFLVATFNFRGASGSAGRTSWTSKPERDDYATMVAFVVYYVHHLDPFRPHSSSSDGFGPQPARLSPPSDAPLPILPPPVCPVLLMGGYSYGAMITTQIPPLYAILEPFASPPAGSDAAEVRLRAEHLAQQQNVVLASARSVMLERGIRSPSKRGVRIGGDEGGSPRKSHESHGGRRSFSFDAEDKFRRGVHDFVAKAKSGRHGHKLFHAKADSRDRAVTPPPQPPQPSQPQPDDKLAAIRDLTMPNTAYLLISPLQGLVTHLATLSLVPTALAKRKTPHEAEAEEKLVRNPTLAVFGDTDVFVASHKLRTWATRIEGRQGSKFQSHEVTTAGHFWVEEGVLHQMRDEVAAFADRLLTN